MTTRKVGAARLQKLATALDAAVKAKKYELNMDCFVMGCDADPGRHCGTVGCALGYCPVVFPRSWCYDRDKAEPRLKAHRMKDAWSVFTLAGDFFGIHPSTAVAIFGSMVDPQPTGPKTLRAVVQRMHSQAKRMLKGQHGK